MYIEKEFEVELDNGISDDEYEEALNLAVGSIEDFIEALSNVFKEEGKYRLKFQAEKLN